MNDSPAERKIRHPVVVRVLVSKGRNQKRTEEFTCHILRERYAGIFGESSQARSVSRIRIAGDVDRGDAGDGQEIEGVNDISRG